MIAVPLPPGQRCNGQMPPYLWSLQAGEDPGRISSSPILPVPLWEPPLRLCPTGILAKRRPPRRAQPAGPAATPLICSAQAGVSRGSPVFCRSSNEDTCWPCSPACPRPGRSTVGCSLGPLPAQTACREGSSPRPCPAGKAEPQPHLAPPGRPAKRLEPAEQHTRGSARRTEPVARFSQRVTPNPDTSPVGPGARSAHAPSQPLPALFPLQPAQPWRQTAHGTHHGPSSGLLMAHSGWVNGPAEKLAAPHGRDTGSEPSPRLLRSWCGWPRQCRRCRQRGWPSVDSPDSQPHPSPGSHSAHHAASPRQGTQPPVPPISLRPTAQAPRASPPARVHKPKRTHRVKT